MFSTLGLFENKHFFSKIDQITTQNNETSPELVDSEIDFDIKRKVALKSQSKLLMKQPCEELESFVEANYWNPKSNSYDDTNFNENSKYLSRTESFKKILTFSNGFLASQAISLLISHSRTLLYDYRLSVMVFSIAYNFLLSIGLIFHIYAMKFLWSIKINQFARWNSLPKIVLGFHSAHFMSIFFLTGFNLYFSFDQSDKVTYDVLIKLVPIHVNLAMYLLLHFFNFLVYVCSLVSDFKFLRELNKAKIYNGETKSKIVKNLLLLD